MGAGKTSVGRAVGQKLGWRFEDLDDRIQRREGRSINQIFRESGEAEFRRAEHAALRELLSELDRAPRIVALGGGAFVQPQNAILIKESAAVAVFLDAGVEELFRRCREDDVERPLGRDKDHFRKLYEERRPLYMAAGMCIQTDDKDVEEVVAEVFAQLGFDSQGDSQ